MGVWHQQMKAGERSSENPPYLLYARSIVIKKADRFIRQSPARVTLFLSSIVSVTFWDKAVVCPKLVGREFLTKIPFLCKGKRALECVRLYRTNWDTKADLSKGEMRN